MNINTTAIEALREGLTGEALANQYLRTIATSINGGVYALAAPVDRLSYENGLLRAYLRRACDLLSYAVDEPEPLPTMDDVRAFEADAYQDGRVTQAKEDRRGVGA